ncbi:MAG: hypothetical protein P8O22_10160 [Akkermansiaceae bacterium]|nr:hypothetical protein [Akkermansiaceae bacterium]
MKTLTILAVTGIALQCGLAQEPFTYKPEEKGAGIEMVHSGDVRIMC